MLTELIGLILLGAFLLYALTKQKKSKNALLIIDVQNDFLPEKATHDKKPGSLAVKDADQVIPVINELRKVKFDMIALTQDFHPKDHCSFYTNNEGSKVFNMFKLPSGEMQMMWPPHCAQGTKGAEFADSLVMEETDVVVKKGLKQNVDSYSGFYDNDHKSQSEMESKLKAAGITTVFIVGIAYDYCVGYSALDAKAAGFNVYVCEDATRGVAPESTDERVKELIKAGVHIIKSTDILPDGTVKKTDESKDKHS